MLLVLRSAAEQGFIYSLVALALYLSYRTLDIADLTTDGTFTLGCAISATMTLAGHPLLGLVLAIAAGAAVLQTKLGVPSILAGIITMTGLYSVNLAAMGSKSNLPMLKEENVFSMAQALFGSAYKLVVAGVFAAVCAVLLGLFLRTRLGLSIRATGDNWHGFRVEHQPRADDHGRPVRRQCAHGPVRSASGAVSEIFRHRPRDRYGRHRPCQPHHR